MDGPNQSEKTVRFESTDLFDGLIATVIPAPILIDQQANAILRVLSESDWMRWRLRLTPVRLELYRVVYEANSHLQHVYLPVSGVLTMQYYFEDGHMAEFAEIGNEGLTGTFAFSGNATSIWTCSVMRAGWAYMIDIGFLLKEFEESSAFRSAILRYMQVLMLITAQTAVCNRRHSISQQFAKILLLNHDRLMCDDLVFTHQLMANLMGVRREAISLAANQLQELGAIEYKRGNIFIKSRISLENACCECYRIIHNEIHRVYAQTV